MTNELLDLCNTGKYDTDKYFGHPWKTHCYVEEVYGKYLAKRKETAKNVLEIGIYSGGSVLLWRDYFPNATIYGMDIKNCRAIEGQDRIVQMVGDAYSDGMVNRVRGIKFDVIIDDGPHTLDSMTHYFNKYLSLLNEGGIFILEDIPNPEWIPHLKDLIPEKFKNKTQMFDLRDVTKQRLDKEPPQPRKNGRKTVWDDLIILIETGDK